VKLYYFDESEFERGGRNWFPDMDPRLLVLLDVFRHRWGRRIAISAHPAALGRLMDRAANSDHNFTRWGAVLAADVMPAGMISREDGEHALELANEVGFTSIGIYPDWHPGPGLHLGVRPGCVPGRPALWGAVNDSGTQAYVAIDKALRKMPPAMAA
jgi:hypothetical protein